MFLCTYECMCVCVRVRCCEEEGGRDGEGDHPGDVSFGCCNLQARALANRHIVWLKPATTPHTGSPADGIQHGLLNTFNRVTGPQTYFAGVVSHNERELVLDHRFGELEWKVGRS